VRKILQKLLGNAESFASCVLFDPRMIRGSQQKLAATAGRLATPAAAVSCPPAGIHTPHSVGNIAAERSLGTLTHDLREPSDNP
jgi:hypothetical protein